jgi:pheromone shutdown protein TraB
VSGFNRRTQERIMTEYEMISTFQATTALALAILASFMTLISAYLAAGYLASHRISLSMAMFVSVLFVVFAAGLISGMTNARNFNVALLGEMRSYADAGKGLTWTPGYKSPRTLVGPIMDYTIIIILVLSVVGSVYFFFQCRRMNRHVEMEPKATATGVA